MREVGEKKADYLGFLSYEKVGGLYGKPTEFSGPSLSEWA
jgi:hypothetical protein